MGPERSEPAAEIGIIGMSGDDRDRAGPLLRIDSVRQFQIGDICVSFNCYRRTFT